MKSILINQPRGLGDILFCQKIAHKLLENNFSVYWYTATYFWIKDYINIPNFYIVNTIVHTDYVLELQSSIESNHPHDLMTCKYKMIGKTLQNLPESLHNIDHNDWSKYLIFNRNTQKENELFYNYLKLNDGEEYILVNKNYGISQINENVDSYFDNNNIKIIYLDFIDSFTLFDWCKVIENAKYINTVDTSLIFLVESLNIKAEKLNMFPRHPEHTEKALEDVLKCEWTWR